VDTKEAGRRGGLSHAKRRLAAQVERAGMNYFEAGVTTDQRRAVVLATSPSVGCTFEDACFAEVDLEVAWRPAANVALSLEPAYAYSESRAQYVTAVPDATTSAFAGTRYVFSDLEQHEVSMETRLAVTFTPSLTLELYAQPFIASGLYTSFKEFAEPRGLEKLVYGTDAGTVVTRPGEPQVYEIDPDGAGPAEPFAIDDRASRSAPGERTWSCAGSIGRGPRCLSSGRGPARTCSPSARSTFAATPAPCSAGRRRTSSS
jgi:hypothetical protein